LLKDFLTKRNNSRKSVDRIKRSGKVESVGGQQTPKYQKQKTKNKT